MRRQLRANAYLRMIENRFVSTESGFVPAEWWAACEDPALRPTVTAPDLAVWVGVDASVRRDSTAVVAVPWDAGGGEGRVVGDRVGPPPPGDPTQFVARRVAGRRGPGPPRRAAWGLGR